MRPGKEIKADGSRPEFLVLEVLLDIRDLLAKELKKKNKTKQTK